MIVGGCKPDFQNIWRYETNGANQWSTKFQNLWCKAGWQKKELQNLEMHSLHRNAYLACKEAINADGTTTSNQTVRMWLERRVCWPCHELCSINLSHLEAWHSICIQLLRQIAKVQSPTGTTVPWTVWFTHPLLSQEAWHGHPPLHTTKQNLLSTAWTNDTTMSCAPVIIPHI